MPLVEHGRTPDRGPRRKCVAIVDEGIELAEVEEVDRPRADLRLAVPAVVSEADGRLRAGRRRAPANDLRRGVMECPAERELVCLRERSSVLVASVVPCTMPLTSVMVVSLSESRRSRPSTIARLGSC